MNVSWSANTIAGCCPMACRATAPIRVQATERRDEMFAAMATRSAAQILENESYTALKCL